MVFLPKNYVEISAATVAFLNIYLAARNSIWNWLFGLIAVTLYAFIFFHKSLYGDMSLQGVYFAFQIYGFYQWRFGSARHTPLSVTRVPVSWYGYIAAIFAIFFAGFYGVLSHYTNSTTPIIDAFTTALSLIAQWMMCKKFLENWWLWMIMDVISLDMYWHKQLYITTGLYASFLILCIIGYRTWKKALYH